MNMIKCETGRHYYDADKYSRCPYCDEAEQNEKTVSYDFDDDIQPTVPTEGISNIQEIDDSSDKTIGVATWSDFLEGQQNSPVEPVVGWLVCISGAEFGKSFIIKGGKNFIGRSNMNDIVISGDKSISREKHAIVVYDPKSRKFHAQPGTSSELFYINEEVVLQVKELKHRDKISIGDTELIFIEFCGSDFSWDELKK